jgi:hypothetical protein
MKNYIIKNDIIKNEILNIKYHNIMLFVEFELNIKSGLNILKYRNVNDDIWYYLYI